jgi:hypothetical protein
VSYDKTRSTTKKSTVASVFIGRVLHTADWVNSAIWCECDRPNAIAPTVPFAIFKTVANRDFFTVILKKETAIGLFLSLARILGIPASEKDISVTGGGPVNVILEGKPQ